MKNEHLASHILFILSAILFAVGCWVLIRLTSRPAAIGMVWPWLICQPAGGAGLLYVGRDFRR